MAGLTRRRLLTVTGAAAGLTLLPGVSTTARWTWRGAALGARAEMTLVHLDEVTAKKLICLAVDEIERLENVFSLHREHSEISRLNREGRLEAPSPDLVSLLSTAHHFSGLTDGAFDVTVQPLWHLYAAHFSQPGANPGGPPQAMIDTTRRLVDYQAIELGSKHIHFARPGMAITLNGIAQGYITDRVADLLRAHGIGQMLIDIGEIRALGRRPDGRPWQVAIDGRTKHQAVDLENGAIATSSPAGTVFDPTGRFHHLFDPTTARPSAEARSISLIAKSTVAADALSTAVAIMPKEKLTSLGQHLVDVRIVQAS